MGSVRTAWVLAIVTLIAAESRGQINPRDFNIKDLVIKDYVVKDADQRRMADEQQKRLVLLKQQGTTRPATTNPTVNPTSPNSTAPPPGKVWRWRAKPDAPQAMKDWVASFDEVRKVALDRLNAQMALYPDSAKRDEVNEEWKRLKAERERIADPSQVPVFTSDFEYGRVMQLGEVQVQSIVDANTFEGRCQIYRVRIQGMNTAGLQPKMLKKIDIPMRVTAPKPGNLINPVYVLEPFNYAPHIERYAAPAPAVVIRKPKAAQPAPPGSVHVLLASIPTDPKSEEPLAMTESQQKQFPQWAQRNLVGKILETTIRSDEFEPVGKAFAVRGFGSAVFENGLAICFEVQTQLDQSQNSMVPARATGPIQYERKLTGRVKQVMLVPQTPAMDMKPAIPARIIFVLSDCKLKEDTAIHIDGR